MHVAPVRRAAALLVVGLLVACSARTQPTTVPTQPPAPAAATAAVKPTPPTAAALTAGPSPSAAPFDAARVTVGLERGVARALARRGDGRWAAVQVLQRPDVQVSSFGED